MIAALGLARFTLMQVRGWCADSPLKRAQLAGERDAAITRAAQLEEEARILRARLERIPPQRRPQYPPVERMAILSLRAAAGWTAAETGRRFQICEATVASWMGRLDEEGPDALVAMRRSITEYTEMLTELIHELREKCPALGKRRTADVLARGGLHIDPSTVQRHRRKPRPTLPQPPETPRGQPETEPAQNVPAPQAPAPKRVTANRPHHVWHTDLTILPTVSGWWVPWIPQALAQCWPFCFWLAVVLDQYTRSVVAWKLYRKQPDAGQIVALFERAVCNVGQAPKHSITDAGVQFRGEYLAWCTRRGVQPRRGAVGKHGSIAVIERFFRSMKEEMLRRLAIVPLRDGAMAAEITAYLDWYHDHRPHQGLAGLTPTERAGKRQPLRLRKPVELTPSSPLARGDPSHDAASVRVVRLHVTALYGRAHLPVVELRTAA